jgi:hypothetical protein
LKKGDGKKMILPYQDNKKKNSYIPKTEVELRIQKVVLEVEMKTFTRAIANRRRLR